MNRARRKAFCLELAQDLREIRDSSEDLCSAEWSRVVGDIADVVESWWEGNLAPLSFRDFCAELGRSLAQRYQGDGSDSDRAVAMCVRYLVNRKRAPEQVISFLQSGEQERRQAEHG